MSGFIYPATDVRYRYNGSLYDVVSTGITLADTDRRYLKIGYDVGQTIDAVSGVIPGTAAAGKALILDSNRNIANVNALTMTDLITINRGNSGAPLVMNNGTSRSIVYHFLDGDVRFGTTTAHGVGIQTSNTVQMSINGAGNFGMPAINTLYKLNITGALRVNSINVDSVITGSIDTVTLLVGGLNPFTNYQPIAVSDSKYATLASVATINTTLPTLQTIVSADSKYATIASVSSLTTTVSGATASITTINTTLPTLQTIVSADSKYATLASVDPLVGVVAGTASATKALITNSTKDIANINQISLTDNIIINRSTNGAPIRCVNGTSTVVLYSFRDGPSYFGSTTAHDLCLQTNNSIRLIVNATGLVGIPSIDNSYQLNVGNTGIKTSALKCTGVVDATSFTINGQPLGSTQLTMTNGAISDLSATPSIKYAINNSGYNAGHRFTIPGAFNYSGSLLRITNEFTSESFSVDYVQLASGGAPKLRLYTSGAALSLTSGTDSGDACITITAGTALVGIKTHTPDSAFAMTVGGAGLLSRNLVQIDNIGTLLTLNGSSGATTDRTSMTFKNSTTEWEYSLGGSAHATVPLGLYWSNGTTRMTLSAAGSLGIGTTNPLAPLHVVGTKSVSVGSGGTNVYQYLMSSDTWSNLSLGPQTFNLSAVFSGAIQTNGIYSSSDRRLKKDIKTLEMDIEKYKSIKPVSFKYIGETRSEIGVIAQEMLGICSEIVNISPNQKMKVEDEKTDLDKLMFSVDYSKLAVLNTTILQQVLARLERLEGGDLLRR